MNDANNSGGNQVRRGILGKSMSPQYYAAHNRFLTAIQKPLSPGLRGPRAVDAQYESIKPTLARRATRDRNMIRRRLGLEPEILPPQADPITRRPLNIERVPYQGSNEPATTTRNILETVLLSDGDELISLVSQLIRETERVEFFPHAVEGKKEEGKALANSDNLTMKPDPEVEASKQALRFELIAFRETLRKAMYEMQEAEYDILIESSEALLNKGQSDLIAILKRYGLN